ncbi:MAG: hypothetical protein K2G85_00820 [Muribaculaceae bacterium]|nr:hypothetical protein [Muribaculaceae bacterium]
MEIQINGKHWINWKDSEMSALDSDKDNTSPSSISLEDLKIETSLDPEGTFPTGNIRIALNSGEAEKAQLMLEGDIMRVDCATAERITHAIVEKAAQFLLDTSTELRRKGLFILPFRFYTMSVKRDGSLSYPTPQAVALPADFPPHPEITAHSITSDTLTLALRIPVKPHRLTAVRPAAYPSGFSLRTFISYPLYIPDPKEMRGSIGSVKSATGTSTTGIRFAFLSASSIKASVAAPEKYYEWIGNKLTGYRMSSKAALAPDYSVYAKEFGAFPAISRASMLAPGIEVSANTDPMEWIADWVTDGERYLPVSLPYNYRNTQPSESGESKISFTNIPFRIKDDCGKHGTVIRTLRLHGLPSAITGAVLYGSPDKVNWEAVRQFDPRKEIFILTPPRIWWKIKISASAT